jgi:hypothetical protein
MAATPSVQPRLWRGKDTIRCATVTAKQHRTHGQAAKHSTAPGEDAGVVDAIQPAETPPQAPRVGQKPQRDRAGEDQAAGARSTEATHGGDGDERRQDRQITAVRWKSLGRQSKCPAWRRHSSPELAGARRNRVA